MWSLQKSKVSAHVGQANEFPGQCILSDADCVKYVLEDQIHSRQLRPPHVFKMHCDRGILKGIKSDVHILKCVKGEVKVTKM